MCILIEFNNPPVGDNMTAENLELFSQLPQLFSTASSSLGFVIQLQKSL